MSEHSVTRWIGQVKAGDEAAAQSLWNRYFEKLVRLCRKKLPPHRRRGEDEEDVALSAVVRAFDGLRNGKFPQVTDRDDLWRLLVRIAAGKAIDRLRAEECVKRGGGRVLGESALNRGDLSSFPDLDRVMGAEPSPDFAASVMEEYRRLLACLSSDDLRRVAVMKTEGMTNREIAAQLDCAERSVERKLRLIRLEWSAIDRDDAKRPQDAQGAVHRH